MTRTTKLITGGVIAAVLAAAVVVGAHLHDDAAVAAPGPTFATAPTGASTATTTATTPTPTPTTMTVPAAGATVPVDQVTAARAAGGHVYVSPNGSGDGRVVAAGQPLPPVIVTDWAATGAEHVGTTTATETARSKAISSMLSALIDVDVPVVTCQQMGAFKDGKLIDTFWTYGVLGVPDNSTINRSLSHQPTRAAALHAARKLAALYGAQVLEVG